MPSLKSEFFNGFDWLGSLLLLSPFIVSTTKRVRTQLLKENSETFEFYDGNSIEKKSTKC